MKHSVLDLLGTALVPVLGSDVSAGSSGNGHLALITVSTVRALPNKLAHIVLDDLDLAVITAAFAIIRLGVKLSIHDVVIDELDKTEYCRNVVLHVRNLYVRDSSSR